MPGFKLNSPAVCVVKYSCSLCCVQRCIAEASLHIASYLPVGCRLVESFHVFQWKVFESWFDFLCMDVQGEQQRDSNEKLKIQAHGIQLLNCEFSQFMTNGERNLD